MKFKIIALLSICLLVEASAWAQAPAIHGLKKKAAKIEQQKFDLWVGEIEVPEDRDKPNGRSIKLPVHRYVSKNPNPAEPVFVLNGGPGASNMTRPTFHEFLANHDVIVVGYRGADGSCILTSKKIKKAIKGKGSQLLSDASLDRTGKVFKSELAKFEKKGIDLAKYTMLDVIDDLEYVRKAVNAPQISLYSGSYGTRVALLYAYKYPAVIHRSVMVGANPPGRFLWDPAQMESILEVYDSIYKAQQLPNYKGSIRAAMRKAFDNMPKRWAAHRLNADKIKCMTFAMTYATDGAAMVFDAYFDAANKGDYAGLYLLQLFFDYGMDKTGSWGDMFTKGLSADFDPKKDYRKTLRAYESTTTLGPNYNLLLWGLAGSVNTQLIPAEYRQLRPCATPTLLLSGNLDVSTPAINATQELLPTLANGHQVVLHNYSHKMVNGPQKAAIRAMMARFIDTGQVDASAIMEQPLNFTPNKSLTKMAKRGFPIWVVLGWLH